MKIAFTTKGTQWDSEMDPRFGRATYFVVYDDVTEELTHFDNSSNGNEAHGAGPKAAQILFDLKVNMLITGNGPGGNAAVVVNKAGIEVYVGAGEMTVEQAYAAFKNGQLKKA